MPKPKEVLGPEDYGNYRNVRAVAVLYIVFGAIFALGGIGMATEQKPDPRRDIPRPAAIAMSVVGFAGVIGGIAALRGNRRWAKLAYVMAVPYLLAFPIGTIMSYIMLTGLSRYLDSKERIRKSTAGSV
jgi:hypothetical protein